MLFLALGTQWRWHPMAGIRTGLIYEAVRPTARDMGIKMTPRRSVDIRVMEGAAIAAFDDAR